MTSPAYEVPLVDYAKAQKHFDAREFHDTLLTILKAHSNPDGATGGQCSGGAADDGGKMVCQSLVEQSFARLRADHYLALKVQRSATAKEIKKSYLKLCLAYHPDKSRANTAELFQCISKAYEVLSDESAKSKYDARSGSYATNKENKAPSAPRGYSKPPPARPAPSSAAPPPPPPGSSSSSSSSSGYRSRSASADAQRKTARSGSGTHTIPSMPRNVKCTEVTDCSATFQWDPAPGADSGTTTYEIQTRLVHELGWPKASQGVQGRACRKKNLNAATAYHFRVRSVNGTSGMRSAWSLPVTIVTTNGITGTKTGAPFPRRQSAAQDHKSAQKKAMPTRARRATAPQATTPPPPPSATPPPPPTSAARSTSSGTASSYSYVNRQRHGKSDAGPIPPKTGPAGSSKASSQAANGSKETGPRGDWTCQICSRTNGNANAKCRVCGTGRTYNNVRIDRISEKNDDDVRARARQSFTERTAKARAKSERAPRGPGASASQSPASAQPPPPPPAPSPRPSASATSQPPVPPPAPSVPAGKQNPSHRGFKQDQSHSNSKPRPGSQHGFASGSTSAHSTPRPETWTPPGCHDSTSSTPRSTEASSPESKEARRRARRQRKQAERETMRQQAREKAKKTLSTQRQTAESSKPEQNATKGNVEVNSRAKGPKVQGGSSKKESTLRPEEPPPAPKLDAVDAAGGSPKEAKKKRSLWKKAKTAVGSLGSRASSLLHKG